MNKSKEGLLAVNENSIFYKIKNFFKRLFFKSESLVKEEKIEEIKIQHENTKTSSFLEDIKIKENKEFKELLYLQKLFKMGRIKEKDLSKEERIGLEKLYKQQIYDLKKSINGYKNKIISIRTKLAQSN